MITMKWPPKLAACAALLAAALMPFAAGRAHAAPLPNTPVVLGDTAFNFVTLFPFGGIPQNTFASLGPGQLNFTLNLGALDPDAASIDFLEVRMDIGVQGNTQYVNLGGTNQAGEDDEGVLVGGNLPLFNVTKWSWVLDGTPIALSYFGDTFVLPDGAQAILSIDFVSSATSETPLPGALPLFAGGLGLFASMAWRRRKPAARISVG